MSRDILSDEAKVGKKAAHFLLYANHMRGGDDRDPCHREWNDALDAVQETGLEGQLIDEIVTVQFPYNACLCFPQDCDICYGMRCGAYDQG